MKLKLSIFALLALLMASCTHEIDIPEPVEPAEKEGEMVTITATIPQETRVSYNEGSLGWQDNDKLLLAGYDGTTYLGSQIFTYTGNGNQFSGTKVPGATTYKAYYPGDVITLDGNGNMQLPANFWQQTYNVQNPMGHIGKKLLLSDTDANALSESFALTARNSVIKFVLDPAPMMYNLKKLIWTVETVKGVATQLAILDIDNISWVFGNLTLYLAFDPTVMKIAPNGTVKIMLIGDSKHEWSTDITKAGGMTYEAGKRYTATVTNGVWADIPQPQFRFTIQTAETNQLYEIWQKDVSSTNPAELTINWGDGTANTPIAKNASLVKTIADHTYVSPGNYTITITSDEVDPSVKQMPQIIFFNEDTQTGDKLLTSILDPFPNMGATDFNLCFLKCAKLSAIPADLFKYNRQVTHFESSFFYCSGLTAIPVGLFSNNTQATHFNGCFHGCTGLTSLPAGLFSNNTQATNFTTCFAYCTGLTSLPAGLFSNNTQADRFIACFRNCTSLTSLPAELFSNNTQATNLSQCFHECTGLTSIPAGLFNNNTGAKDFTSCFRDCSQLTSIPEDLFKYNMQATSFIMCFNGCIRLQLIQEIFPDPNIPANADFFAGRNMDFLNCFSMVGSYYTTPTGSAPELWKFNGGGTGTTWRTTYCFTGANVIDRILIPQSWGGDLADLGNVTKVDGEDW
ncbi:MAG: hypothetical protein ACOX19_05570 [Fermentimonas sp.]|jgi:hypothetical protein